MKLIQLGGLNIQSQSILALALLLSLSSCEMKKNLDEMHDATMDMSETTKKMEASTSKMLEVTTAVKDETVSVSAKTTAVGEISAGIAETSRNIEGHTVEMYDDLKQGDSLAARRNGLISLTKATDPSMKISEAAKYFMSFEFQLWSGAGKDTYERREELMVAAAKEFLRDAQEFADANQTEANPTANLGDPNQNLNALSVAMHFVNPKQTETLHKYPAYREITMYSILKDGLAASREIESGKKTARDFPPHVREVLIYERVARLLVQSRYNYYGSMALGKATQIRTNSKAFKFWTGIELSTVTKVRMAFRKWNLDFTKLGVTEVEETGKYMEGALKAFDFMRSNGIVPTMNKNLKRIYRNMRPSNALILELGSVRLYNAALAARQSNPTPPTPHALKAASTYELMDVYMKSADDLDIKLPKNVQTAPQPVLESKH